MIIEHSAQRFLSTVILIAVVAWPLASKAQDEPSPPSPTGEAEKSSSPKPQLAAEPTPPSPPEPSSPSPSQAPVPSQAPATAPAAGVGLVLCTRDADCPVPQVCQGSACRAAPPRPLPQQPTAVAPSSSPLPATEQVKEPQGPLADAKDAEDEHAFSWFSAAPELGYTFFPEAAMQVNGFKATVNARNGFVAKLHLDLGGDGLSFEIAPLFAVEAGGIDQSGGSFGSTSVDPRNLSGSFQSIGAQLGAVYRFKISRFYPHVGLGLHAAYVMGRDIEYGAEIYGRIPLGFTLYLAKHLGLVVEAGFMYGVTGIKQPFSNIDTAQLVASAGLDQQAADELASINSRQELEQWLATYESQLSAEQAATLKQDVINNALAQSIRFGNGFGLDLMIGLRFP